MKLIVRFFLINFYLFTLSGPIAYAQTNSRWQEALGKLFEINLQIQMLELEKADAIQQEFRDNSFYQYRDLKRKRLDGWFNIVFGMSSASKAEKVALMEWKAVSSTTNSNLNYAAVKESLKKKRDERNQMIDEILVDPEFSGNAENRNYISSIAKNLYEQDIFLATDEISNISRIPRPFPSASSEYSKASNAVFLRESVLAPLRRQLKTNMGVHLKKEQFIEDQKQVIKTANDKITELNSENPVVSQARSCRLVF